MREYFFFLVIVLAAASVVLWFLWIVIRALYTVVSDLKLERELKQLEKESRENRRKRLTNKAG